MAKEYDLVIVGGGTGGYVAAIRASQLGLKLHLLKRKSWWYLFTQRMYS